MTDIEDGPLSVSSNRSGRRLCAGAWHGDRPFGLDMPDNWDVRILWPQTPPEVTDRMVDRALTASIGQPPLPELLKGVRKPLIIVDDPTRPTPVGRVLPPLLRQMAEAGIDASSVTVLIATGTHGPPTSDGLREKLGSIAYGSCRIVVHNHLGAAVNVGRTQTGIPVLVDPEVAMSDFVVGVGGVYPQHTTWFGGGSKLMLGVLHERSIAALHYRNWKLNTRYASHNSFRRDLDEVAALAGLRTSLLLHVNEERRLVRLAVGAPGPVYEDASRFSREAYLAPVPGSADVVIANAFPMDNSLTFAVSKGMTPLKHAAKNASRILLADCPEGGGHHGLFPLVNVPRYHYRAQRLRRAWMAKPETVRAIWRSLGQSQHQAPAMGGPIHLFRPQRSGPLPPVAGVSPADSWTQVVARVTQEQRSAGRLQVLVYSCAPLQVLDFEAVN
jgi:nickel-dependent lactate racemase